MFQFAPSVLSSLAGRRPHATPPTRAARLRRVPTLEALEDRLALSGSPVNLGTAAQYAVLGLTSTQITDSNTTISGDVGVSQDGKLTKMNPSTITGNVYAASSGQGSGSGKPGGQFIVDPVRLAQANTDALNASSQAAALAPTQTLATVSTPTTVTGNGDLNVIKVTGDLKDSLILSGTSRDIFIVNVTGTLSFGGSSVLGLGGGVTADHVLYNFIGPGDTITSKGGNAFNGTLLAPTSRFDFGGVLNGEIIGGGKSIALLFNSKINEVPFALPTTLSGHVYADVDFSGNLSDGESGIRNWTVTLTGTDYLGNAVNLTTRTDDKGIYSFSNLEAGTYQISLAPSGAYAFTGSTVGTAGGTSLEDGSIGCIQLKAGQQGANYNFGEYSFV